MGAANVSREDFKKRDAKMAELQMQEAIEEKRAAIMHIDVPAWYCRECGDYTECQDRVTMCEERQHALTRKPKVKKIRVECENCRHTAFGLGSTIPDHCDRCGQRMIHVSFYKTKGTSDDKYGRP